MLGKSNLLAQIDAAASTIGRFLFCISVVPTSGRRNSKPACMCAHPLAHTHMLTHRCFGPGHLRTWGPRVAPQPPGGPCRSACRLCASCRAMRGRRFVAPQKTWACTVTQQPHLLKAGRARAVELRSCYLLSGPRATVYILMGEQRLALSSVTGARRLCRVSARLVEPVSLVSIGGHVRLSGVLRRLRRRPLAGAAAVAPPSSTAPTACTRPARSSEVVQPIAANAAVAARAASGGSPARRVQIAEKEAFVISFRPGEPAVNVRAAKVRVKLRTTLKAKPKPKMAPKTRVEPWHFVRPRHRARVQLTTDSGE